MTSWQWQVILALIRVVLKLETRTNDDDNEWFDIQVSQDRALLEEAIWRSEKD